MKRPPRIANALVLGIVLLAPMAARADVINVFTTRLDQDVLSTGEQPTLLSGSLVHVTADTDAVASSSLGDLGFVDSICGHGSGCGSFESGHTACLQTLSFALTLCSGAIVDRAIPTSELIAGFITYQAGFHHPWIFTPESTNSPRLGQLDSSTLNKLTHEP